MISRLFDPGTDFSAQITADGSAVPDYHQQQRATVWPRIGTLPQPGPQFDAIAQAAADPTGASMVVVNAFYRNPTPPTGDDDGRDHQNFIGVWPDLPHDQRCVKWCIGYCPHVLENGPLVIQDATADPAFADNPLSTRLPAYAGVPIVIHDVAVATLAIGCDRPRFDWTSRVWGVLRPFAEQAKHHILGAQPR